MYCIISLPRTTSTNLCHLLHAPLTFIDPRYRTLPLHSIFNPRYNTPEQIKQKYNEIMMSEFVPLFKIISNHSFQMVQDIIDSKRFKTILVKPNDVRKQVLKTIVAKQTDSFGNKEARNKYKGTLVISEEEIRERLTYYKQHIQFESQCDYSFFDTEILQTPDYILTTLNLPTVKSKYKYSAPTYSDEEMLVDINDFNKKYNTVYAIRNTIQL